ncbi:DUF6397 family protein [Streptomyces qinglanensis]|uniref:Uncharacterized protein n=1 Tax=Streptomyces qinglanensis TaxID=943816 RepID=A0A1H9TZG2_9ACTN|nr:DUF6397 family protein [Streptomyces qinglanensis]SES02556.1 hypothetical protein SAMN05421870_107153 [Streptomyces qinglanensis]
MPAPLRDTAEVSLRTAARELGLRPREFELAVQIEEVRTVPGPAGRTRRVLREEVERIKAAPGFPGALRGRLRVMGVREASALLDISPSRCARLARAGCFGPVSFYVNRYRTVVWLYLAQELRDFAENNPQLLTGRLPVGLRAELEAGVDHRALRWRGRRVEQLTRHAADPWERAAARASVLDDATLAEAVPDGGERARLRALRPCFLEVRNAAEVTRDVLEEVCRAEGAEEIRWYRFLLDADLESARAAEGPAAARAVREPGRGPVEGRPGASCAAAGEGRSHPGTARPVAGPPTAPGPRRRWSLLRRRRPRPGVRTAGGTGTRGGRATRVPEQ